MQHKEYDFSGDRMAELRKDRGWTQKELAEKLDITVQTVSAIETGANRPSVTVLIALAVIFNVSMDYLCQLTDTLRSFQDNEYAIHLPPTSSEEQISESQSMVDLIALKYKSQGAK